MKVDKAFPGTMKGLLNRVTTFLDKPNLEFVNVVREQGPELVSRLSRHDLSVEFTRFVDEFSHQPISGEFAPKGINGEDLSRTSRFLPPPETLLRVRGKALRQKFLFAASMLEH